MKNPLILGTITRDVNDVQTVFVEKDGDEPSTHYMMGVCRIKNGKVGDKVLLNYHSGLWFGTVVKE